MTYTLTAQPDIIVRDEDQAFIPTDPDNIDYQDYLAWLDEGNEPNEYIPPATTLPANPSIDERVNDLDSRVTALEGGGDSATLLPA